MDAENPYESPQAEISEIKPLASQGILTEAMLLHLKGASPWLRFVGIAGFIMCALYVVIGLVMAIGINSLPALYGGAAMLPAMSAVFFVFYLGFAALMFFPTLFIFRFGKKIKNYLHTGNETELELAFKNNKSLWVFTGVLAIISLAFFAIFILFGGIAAVMAVIFSGST